MGGFIVNDCFKVLSLGGGVQSTAMLYLVQDGVLSKPDIVIFADTGSEMPETYKLINDVIKPLCRNINVNFEIVKSHLGHSLDEYYKSRSVIPVIGVSHCTAKFKIRPIRRKIREYVGNGRGKKLAECWLGITTDENQRESISDVKWVSNVFPLLELNYSRNDCINYLTSKGLKVEKSGCFMCPYNSSEKWVRVKNNYPELWKRALDLEDTYFENRPYRYKGLRDDGKKLRQPLTNFSKSKCDSGGCFI